MSTRPYSHIKGITYRGNRQDAYEAIKQARNTYSQLTTIPVDAFFKDPDDGTLRQFKDIDLTFTCLAAFESNYDNTITNKKNDSVGVDYGLLQINSLSFRQCAHRMYMDLSLYQEEDNFAKVDGFFRNLESQLLLATSFDDFLSKLSPKEKSVYFEVAQWLTAPKGDNFQGAVNNARCAYAVANWDRVERKFTHVGRYKTFLSDTFKDYCLNFTLESTADEHRAAKQRALCCYQPWIDMGYCKTGAKKNC